MMMRKLILSTPLIFTAARAIPIFGCQRFFSGNAGSSDTQVPELPRVNSLVEGCDYKHWLVVMQPPENHPQREEIVRHYVTTLAMALGSEKAAKESIYSVSTKYYYAFSCKVSEHVTYKIKCLPRVKLVLPDSYLCPVESNYGGEPYLDGKVVPYQEKYHAEWLRDEGDDNCKGRASLRKSRRKRRGSRNPRETRD